MGLLTEAQVDDITEFVFSIERAQVGFLSGRLEPGEEVAFHRDTGPIEAVVLECNENGALVQFNGANGIRLEQWTCFSRIKRFGLRLTKDELNSYAEGFGCTHFIPFHKQLMYEMRLVRKKHDLMLPMKPSSYIRKYNREASRAAEALAGGACVDIYGDHEVESDSDGGG
jgi:hypothetical protein